MRAGYAGEDCPKVSVMLELIGYTGAIHVELSSHRKSDSNMVKDISWWEVTP